MTTWNWWTCPVCERKWYGSIGWFIPNKNNKEELASLLTKLCGCTEEEVTVEDMGVMGGICAGPAPPEGKKMKGWRKIDLDKEGEIDRILGVPKKGGKEIS